MTIFDWIFLVSQIKWWNSNQRVIRGWSTTRILYTALSIRYRLMTRWSIACSNRLMWLMIINQFHTFIMRWCYNILLLRLDSSWHCLINLGWIYYNFFFFLLLTFAWLFFLLFFIEEFICSCFEGFKVLLVIFTFFLFWWLIWLPCKRHQTKFLSFKWTLCFFLLCSWGSCLCSTKTFIQLYFWHYTEVRQFRGNWFVLIWCRYDFTFFLGL